ncbi:hypothetical protein Ndes2526B_g09033 [Nannochloris sp. 'desiccata']|nr:hypothetical protein KSW81_001414 [Chlorella desiccata (nom. nud.)]KAH7616927.1 hypothetical protein NADE_001730 [Chlorella desiccata (nom. nud.)]
MVGPGSKENYARERILLAISLFQKNALPVIAKQIRSLMSHLHIAYRTLVRVCSANGGLRRFGVAKARQLAGLIAVLATQLAKWRRLIQFVASKAIYIKDMVTKKAPVLEETPTVASENLSQDPHVLVDAVEVAEEQPTELLADPTISQENDNMNALAKYSALDVIQTKNAVTKSPSKKKSNDKIAARRRRR